MKTLFSSTSLFIHCSYECDFTQNPWKYYKWVGNRFLGQNKSKAFISTLHSQAHPRGILSDENTPVPENFIKRFFHVAAPGVYHKVCLNRRESETFTCITPALHIGSVKNITLFSLIFFNHEEIIPYRSLSCISPLDIGKVGDWPPSVLETHIEIIFVWLSHIHLPQKVTQKKRYS